MVEVKHKLSELLEEKFSEPELSDCFLVALDITGENKVEIFIDSDSGINSYKCQRVSRYIEAKLDETGWLGDSYGLEVSSPGLDRPLVLIRQYKKNIGRDIKVTLKDGTVSEGILVVADDDKIIVGPSKKGLKKPNKKAAQEEIEIPYTAIEQSKILIRF